MRKIEYKLYCDFCGKLFSEERYNQASERLAIPKPAISSSLNHYHACFDCADIAIKKLKEYLEANS